MRRAPPPPGRLTDPIGRRIGTISVWSGAGLLGVLVIVRSGVSTYINIDRLLAVASRLPDPARDYRTLSLPGGVLSRVLGIDTEAAWVVLHAGILLAVVAWVAWQVGRWELPAGRHRDAAILLACCQLPAVLLMLIGHYDVFTTAGASAVALGSGPVSLLVGAVLMGTSNAEHALGALAGLAIVALATRRTALYRAVWAMLIVLVIRVGLAVWTAGVTNARINLLFSNFRESMHGVVRAGWFHVFTWYGAAWIFVIMTIVRAGRHRLVVAGGLVLIPMALTLVTLDGTRVFAVACWPAYLEVVRATVATPRAPDENDTNGVDLVRQLSTFVLIIAVLTPAPVTWVGGEPLVPWQDLLDLVP